jgi:serine/threonine-protein kinase RsbW/sigma-B regulation protein RsbU (phosphoserine phosphatase)
VDEAEVRLEVRSDPRLLGVIRGVVAGWLSLHGLTAERAHEVVLAIDEACSNAIRHSYGGRCDETVEVLMREARGAFEFEVVDRGEPCPPDRVERKPLEAPSEDELRPGGLGVQLMYEVFDEVHFAPGESGGNSVTMRLGRPR